MKTFFVSSVLFVALVAQGNGQSGSPTMFTLTDVNSQIQFNFGRSVAVATVGAIQIIHQVWVEITPPHIDSAAQVTGQIMYRHSPDGGVNWSGKIPLTPVISTGYPKVAAYGPYVYVTYHHTVESVPNVWLLYSINMGASWSSVPVSAVSGTSNGVLPSVAAFGTDVHITYGSRVFSSQPQRDEVYYRGGYIANSIINWRSAPLMVSDNNGTQPSGDGWSSWTPDIAADGPNVFITWTDERHHSSGDCAGPPAVPANCLEEVYYRRRINNGASSFWLPEIRLTNLSGGGTGHNASQIAASNGTVHIVLSRKPVKTIHYLKFPYTQSGPPPSGGIGSSIADDPNDEIDFERPAIAVQGSNVHIVFHGTVPFQGMKIYRTESSDGGQNFGVDGAAYVALPDVVGSPNIVVSRQPSIAIDGAGVKHVIFTGNEYLHPEEYPSEFQMYYWSW